MSENPYTSTEQAVSRPKLGEATWTRVSGVVNIIYTVLGLYCILGIPLFISALKLFDAGRAADRFRKSGDAEDAAEAIRSYESAMKLQALNWIILIGLLVVGMLLFFVLAGAGFLEGLKDK